MALSNQDMQNQNEEYFTDLDDLKFTQEAISKVSSYYDFVMRNRLFDLWSYAYRLYHRFINHSGQIKKAGESAEYDILYVNRLKNFIDHMMSLITSSRPAFTPRAINTDSDTQEKTQTAKAVIDYYYKDKDFEKIARSDFKSALLLGEAVAEMVWDTFSGEIQSVDEPAPEITEDGEEIPNPDDEPVKINYEGDLRVYSYLPIDVVRDPNADSWDSLNWVILRRYVDKYELVKRYPDFKDKIMSIASDFYTFGRNIYMDRGVGTQSTRIAVYTLYHKPNVLCPLGMVAQFCSTDTLFFRTALPYDKWPIMRVSAGEVMNTPFAYGMSFDLLPLQTMYDRLMSSFASSASTFSGTSFVAEEGSNVNLKSLGESNNVLYHKKGTAPPTILEKLMIPAQAVQYQQNLDQQMQILSGINEVTLGIAPPNIKSALGLSVMDAKAVQFLSYPAGQFTKYLEEQASNLIMIAKTYAETERVAKIVGQNSDYKLLAWDKNTFQDIDFVSVEIANPALRSLGGRLDLLETMKQFGAQFDNQQIVSVIESGNTDILTEDTVNKQLSIRQETEELVKGTTLPVLITDDDRAHLADHVPEMEKMEFRLNPDYENTPLYQHCLLHIQNLNPIDPMVAMFKQAIGQNVPMPQPQQPIGPQVPFPQPGQSGAQPSPEQSQERAINQQNEVAGIPPGPTQGA